ncbi:hypothetical protein Poly30_54620 [Planctomycetes bacterium Poly30]|uniref:SbsA Ig-like domain-containing protein n=1 Tax=Saltatorellus ferox TaxID=2528018 RepID=A0A518F0P1_9BACT|nr:hypothetical protein Poly30_54620 [Planctomycetes bacterium Poly30]
MLALATGALLSACSGTVTPGGGSDSPTGPGPAFFFEDVHDGGTATAVHWSSLRFGRLVEIEALDGDGARVSMADDFVIRQSLVSDALDYELSLNGVTGQESLLIRRHIDDPIGYAEFLDLLEAAGENLDPIQVQDLETTGVFSMLPRNAALVLTFDDLLRPATITDRSIQVVQGDPPTSPFEARVFPSAHHGGTASDGAFYPTRVIIDMTTSLVEKQRTGTGVPLNGVGLSPSVDSSRANVQVRIPTVLNPSIGLTRIVTNLTNHPLATANNGPVDFGTNARAVTRAFRSGGHAGVIPDPFNGFLRDTTPPRVIGSTPVELMAPPVHSQGPGLDPASLDFILPEIRISSTQCVPGELDGTEVITQNGLFARVVRPVGLSPGQAARYEPDEDGRLFGLPVRVITFPPDWANGPSDWERFGMVSSNLESTFAAGDVPDCYVQVLPRPASYPDHPTTGIDPSSIVSLRFSEPMDPGSLTAFDSVTLTRRLVPPLGALSTADYVVGELNQSATLREVTFVPVLDLAHLEGVAESYYLSLADSSQPFAPRDLAGNPVVSLPSVPLNLQPAAPSRLNGGRVSRFSSTDEEAPVGPEWAGQVQIDPIRQTLRARPVLRQTVVIDSEEQALIAQMKPFDQGVVTPFSPLGSKMQCLWRYADCGFSLTDPNQINIDIEGISWAPAGGSVVPDQFERFAMLMSHSRYAPDEFVNQSNLLPQFPASGLKPIFTQNVLGGETQKVVHPRERGYTIEQADLYRTSSGRQLMPFPLNRGVPEAEKRYFTWRDTRIRGRSGPSGNGVEPLSYPPALGLATAANPYYRAGSVQTIGLPLLMEFRTSVQQSAVGRNGWLIKIASNSSANPYFRAFSTGGINTSGNLVVIDPENETAANGGFNPGSAPPGASTFGRDNSVHIGALDYVTRISQAHSIWFESVIESEGTAGFGGRIYSEPTFEPAPEQQPDGTSIEFFYRGATAIHFEPDGPLGAMDNFSGTLDHGLADYQYDARKLDLYGDYYNDVEASTDTHSPDHTEGGGRDNWGIDFHAGSEPGTWLASTSAINGARYYQVRVTFHGNAATGKAPELSAFAMTWTRE